MLRLVWKDVVLGSWILLGLIPLYVLQLMGLATIGPASLFVTFLFTTAFVFGSIGIEEVQGTETLWCSLPISRADVVLARYATAAIGVVFGLGTSWLVAHAAGAWIVVEPQRSPGVLGFGAYAALFAMFLGSAALFLPCYFRYGAGRGILLFLVLLLAVLFALSALGSVAVYLAGGDEVVAALRGRDPERLALARAWIERWGGLVAAAIAAGAAALFVASSVLSVRFFESRDC